MSLLAGELITNRHQEPLKGRGLALPFTKANKTDAVLNDEDIRLPYLSKVPDSVRNHFVAMTGEFVGTVLFLWFALSGAQVANSIPSSAGLTVAQTGSNPQQLQYIALCFGFSLAVNAWVFFRISGGLFNPAVTFGMCLIGALPWVRGGLLFISQMLGGLVAAALVACMFPGELNVRTSLGGGTTVAQGLFIEMFLTAQLVFTIFMLAAEKHKGTFIAPVGIGLALFVAELTGVYFTGGSLNPARSFGPAAVDRTFNSYHWIYWLGPILGSILASGFYKFIKILEYETANPDQDTDHATKVARRKKLLMAAGINEADASHVAHELTIANNVDGAHEKASSTSGGPDGAMMANGQGHTSEQLKGEGMYGTGYRAETANETTATQRPSAVTTTSGRYSYLARAGDSRKHSDTVPDVGRVDSPGIAPADDMYAPLAEPGQAMGHMVADEPRSRFARTASSGV
ncbi:Aquaporin-1 [Oleoguttula sp. CCFEE 5521]